MLNYIILGMLYNCKLTGYDLKKHIENGVGVFYKASYGSIYPALKRLSENDQVAILETQQGARQKKLYEITPKGQQAFLKWLGEPINLDDGNGKGNQNHLARVYFFDVLPPEVVEQQLYEYEVNNTNYLRRLLALEQLYDSSENQENHYYKLSTLYYGIAILRETIRWCRHVREKRSFHEFINGGDINERSN
ncbi:PadR family transcriptional regulator [Paenibacillus puldeungensis]|uniref:PadR family transcriptional regulator n=1 Tax=Paenibacillus puldeungensis TaxID=696536 RepID=A0ABW3RXY8_9BACL